MASISSLHLSQRPSHGSFKAFSNQTGFNKHRKQTVTVLCSKQQQEEKPLDRVCVQEQDWCVIKRRQAVFQVALSAFSFPVIVADAFAAENDVPEDFRVYADDVNKFKILIPQNWQVGAGEPNGFKSITAFYPEEESNSNVSVVITGLGADFTRMESFGKVEAFADTLVSGLDRSWQRPAGVKAKLIDCKAANGFYYIDYTLQNPGESRKHMYSAIGMASNGWYNRLYTVTGQFVDEESEKFGSRIQKAVASFKFI
ncbi:hypothetical protein Q3G72_012373 [Acer saccharum]|nr:hypothetical protein Q3G72_012373 [Acer saccharum]